MYTCLLVPPSEYGSRARAKWEASPLSKLLCLTCLLRGCSDQEGMEEPRSLGQAEVAAGLQSAGKIHFRSPGKSSCESPWRPSHTEVTEFRHSEGW